MLAAFYWCVTAGKQCQMQCPRGCSETGHWASEPEPGSWRALIGQEKIGPAQPPGRSRTWSLRALSSYSAWEPVRPQIPGPYPNPPQQYLHLTRMHPAVYEKHLRFQPEIQPTGPGGQDTVCRQISPSVPKDLPGSVGVVAS